MTGFATTGHVALLVTIGNGEVAIGGSGEHGVEVDLVPLRDNDATRQAIAEARVEMIDRSDGHEVVVQLQKKSGFTVGRGAKVGVRIRCPRGSDLSLSTGAADLVATGELGVVEVKTASGDVAVEDVGRLRTQSASGDLRAHRVRGKADCRTASGDVRLGRCDGLLNAQLVSGDLAVDEASAGMAVTTVSGDVRFDAVGGGGMRVQSVSGDIHLAMTPGERLYIDASSVSGTMVSELDVGEPDLGDQGPVNELRVRTVSGDLQIVRAVVVRA